MLRDPNVSPLESVDKEMGKRVIFYDRYARAKRRIFILFLVMTFVSLGAGVGILKLSNLKTVGLSLQTVYQDRVQPLKQLKTLSDIYGITIVDTANKVLHGGLTWKQGRKHLNQATKEISRVWGEYLNTFLAEEEKKTIEELQSLFKVGDRALMQLGNIFATENSRALAEFIQKDLYQTIEPVTRKIDELFQIQVKIAKEISEIEKVRYKFGLGFGTASIVLSIILFFLVILQWRRFRALLDSL